MSRRRRTPRSTRSRDPGWMMVDVQGSSRGAGSRVAARHQPSSMTKILLQLDPDPQPSVFDAVVAVDSGVSHLFRHAGVTPEAVRDLVHGALFTRGPDDLKNTAIFVGGSDVRAGEAI